jgi:hypothetical protein
VVSLSVFQLFSVSAFAPVISAFQRVVYSQWSHSGDFSFQLFSVSAFAPVISAFQHVSFSAFDLLFSAFQLLPR